MELANEPACRAIRAFIHWQAVGRLVARHCERLHLQGHTGDIGSGLIQAQQLSKAKL